METYWLLSDVSLQLLGDKSLDLNMKILSNLNYELPDASNKLPTAFNNKPILTHKQLFS